MLTADVDPHNQRTEGNAMTEQHQIPEIDDTEGHGLRRDDEDDTEGHGLRRDDEDDTEGHGLRR